MHLHFQSLLIFFNYPARHFQLTIQNQICTQENKYTAEQPIFIKYTSRDELPASMAMDCYAKERLPRGNSLSEPDWREVQSGSFFDELDIFSRAARRFEARDSRHARMLMLFRAGSVEISMS